MPPFMIFLGKGYTWQHEHLTLDMLIASKVNKVALSPEINGYFKQLVKLLEANQQYFKPAKS